MADSHIHTAGDGRPARNVYVNGNLIERVIFADTLRGIVRYHPYPLRIDRRGERLVERTLRGVVEVKPVES